MALVGNFRENYFSIFVEESGDWWSWWFWKRDLSELLRVRRVLKWVECVVLGRGNEGRFSDLEYNAKNVDLSCFQELVQLLKLLIKHSVSVLG